jgi:hypothetical protein
MKLAFLVAASLAGAYATAFRLGRIWGSTPEERRRSLPGDEFVLVPEIGGDHAITIGAPPEHVWPWLVQMGWHRGGWYTYRWVDAIFFPQNARSAERIVAEYQDLQVGDRILDGPPELGCFFTVEAIEPAHHLVLRSTTHLPPQLTKRKGVSMAWTWAFVLERTGPDSTRFHFRWRGEVRPFWLRLIYRTLVMPADFVMGRSMCLGLKRRAERVVKPSQDERTGVLRS